MHLGDWNIDELLTFAANTHIAGTGAGADAASAPAYRVYEDETGTAILTGTMAKLDDANTIGFYSERLTLSVANGFELGKAYTVYLSATVSSILGTASHTFKIRSLQDMGLLYKGTVATVTDQTHLVISTPRSSNADDYNGLAAIIRDVTNVPSAAAVEIIDYDGAGEIILDAAAPFTVAVGDIVEIIPSLSLPTVAQIAAGLLDLADGVESGLTVREHHRLSAAALYGKSSGHGNNNPKYQDTGATKNRITATTNSDGDRTAITLDKT